MQFKILDHETMSDELERHNRKSVLIVGNHKCSKPVLISDDEYVIVMHMNHNGVAPNRMNMVSSYLWLSGNDYPCQSYFFPRQYPDHVEALGTLGRDTVFLMDQLLHRRAFQALGYYNIVYHPGPTTGFLTLMALEAARVPVRVAGFSWYVDKGETYAVANHNPMEELKYCRDVLKENPLFTFTPECLKYLNIGGSKCLLNT